MSFLVFFMDFGAGALIGAGVGAVVGGIAGLVLWLIRSNKIKKYFNITNGMTYEQITALLGEPADKKEKGEKITCKWHVYISGKPYKVTAIFKDNLLKSIG